jgi:hypothetical protein
MMAMFTLMAVSLFRTDESIAIPCSVNVKDRYFECFPFRLADSFSKVAFGDVDNNLDRLFVQI